MDLTTVADDFVVVHDGLTVHAAGGLEPDTEYTVAGLAVRTLARPPGELLCRFATVNDLHFGEVECGVLDEIDAGPILRAAPGDPPYPTMMNQAAAAEIARIDPVVVIAKGDLTDSGADAQIQDYLNCYREPFGDKLRHVRGNHDAYVGSTFAAGNQWFDLPGVRCVVIDTVRPGRVNGTITEDTLAWLDDALDVDEQVLLFGHHQVWNSASHFRTDRFDGLLPAASEALAERVGRHPNVLAYFAGHTHRNVVVRLPESGDVPYVEVACVKDFPGTWAEYRVYEGGVIQIHHRISSPEALVWSEKCRSLYSGIGLDYSTWASGQLSDRCFTLLRSSRSA